MPESQAPPISEALIKWLEELFPDRLPDAPVDPAALGTLIGKQQVIRKLRKEHERQNRNILDAS